MYLRMIRTEIFRSKMLSLTIAAFVAAAALLVALAATLTVHLAGSIDSLMERAVTPHFMQMHSGSVDFARLSAFAKGRDDIESFQVKEFLNVDGDAIVIGGRSLGGSVQDNGLDIQGESFDFLLDLDGKRIEVRDGEVYVPVCYLKDGSAREGDAASICGKPFRVAGFLRDSQMNSLLSSSKRFLVGGKDFEEVRDAGSVEYLIEFRLDSPAEIGAFEAAYAAAGLEANGPTITYPLFRTLNAITDGLMIAVILLVSVLVTLIAFLCIRFALLAQIEDEYREIGVMKAIGLRHSTVKKLYLAKYAALAAVGALAGAALSIPARTPLLENIRLTMGESGDDALAFFFGLLGAFFVFLAIVVFVNGVLGRFRKISAAQAVWFGTAPEKSAAAKGFVLYRNETLGANAFLGIKDVLSRKKMYAVMLAVFAFALFIMLVPRNLHRTISSEDFSAYMGIGRCDLRIDIRQTGDIARKAAVIEAAMKADAGVSRFTTLTTKSFAVRMDDGSTERIKLELGDHSAFPVRYSSGRAAAGDSEIALSALNAEALGKKVGDFLRLTVGGRERVCSVSGIYSDITNGGKTAKGNFSDEGGEIMWCVVSAELADPSTTDSKAREYAERFLFAKVSGIGEFVSQTFGPTVDAIKKASDAAMAVALAVSALVTLLFMRLLVAKDRHSIAVMKALGFLNSEITTQYLTRTACVLIAGIVCGIVLAGTLGEALSCALFSAFGASSFKFATDPVASYLLYPLLLAASAAPAAVFGASGVRGIAVAENSKE